jgi:hypothetical protein
VCQQKWDRAREMWHKNGEQGKGAASVGKH